MKERLQAFGYYVLFWFLFCLLTKVVFLGNHFLKFLYLPISDWFGIFLHGFQMDLSTIAWITLLPGILLTISTFIKNNKIVHNIMRFYTLFLLVALGIFLIADIEWYRYWGTHLTHFSLSEGHLLLENALGQLPLTRKIKLLVTWLLMSAFFYFLYTELVGRHTKELTPSKRIVTVALGVLTLIFLIPIRGFGKKPMSTTSAYFSKHPFANHAATNIYWNAIYELLSRAPSPKKNFPKSITQEAYKKHYAGCGKTRGLLNTDQPNIMLIVLRSYPSKLIAPLMGRDSITPHFNRLSHQGVLFDHFYANGNTWDKGLSALINACPSLPQTNRSIAHSAESISHTPSLARHLKGKGYHTSMIHGFKKPHFDFRSYLRKTGFDNITIREGFEPKALPQGLRNPTILDKLLEEANTSSRPFFKVAIETCNQDINKIIFHDKDAPLPNAETEEEKAFVHTAYHTDEALGRFIFRARENDWWENTLVIITADQGSHLPGNSTHHSPERFHIPMLWLGGALRKKDTTIHTYGMQSDLPETLMKQLGMTDTGFGFSNDMLCEKAHSFALYAHSLGYGYVKMGTKIIYDNLGGYYIEKTGIKDEKDLEAGSILLQHVAETINDTHE